MQQPTDKSIYFLSDFHLGAPNFEKSLEREKLVVAFLQKIKKDASEIFILGDIFDFWFEYKYVVPKGYTRLLGTFAQITDVGIPIHFFVGNHDMWMKNYFLQELNIQVYFKPEIFVRDGKKLFVGHGDGLGPGDKGYKRLKKVFRNPLSQWLFGIFPPAWGIGMANYFSQKSRLKTGSHEETFLGMEKEWLVQYAQKKLQGEHFDYFIFGHRHLPIHLKLSEGSEYINLGDWIQYFTYATFTQGSITLASFAGNDEKIIRKL